MVLDLVLDPQYMTRLSVRPLIHGTDCDTSALQWASSLPLSLVMHSIHLSGLHLSIIIQLFPINCITLTSPTYLPFPFHFLDIVSPETESSLLLLLLSTNSLISSAPHVKVKIGSHITLVKMAHHLFYLISSDKHESSSFQYVRQQSLL